MANLYKVFVGKSAAKELKKLPIKTNNVLIPLIQNLSGNPRPSNCKKLSGTSNKYRIRSGNYRIVNSIDDEIRIVDIRSVGHRKDIYR
ncbi:MAG TPA: type II toxin-antitoxin system RelE/ParE family toxin [Fulvivirga sp.]|nr:type II toxin-antitoxin system RelE/ParE family toxin [Fulvivirga sp.]